MRKREQEAQGLLTKARQLHFVGIGGIGMSSLAAILLERGYTVSGSDVKPTPLTKGIEGRGGTVCIGHRRSNVPQGTQLLVYSSCIDGNNPEIKKAREEKIPVVHRADIVAAFVNAKVGVAITGAHGKTTTTALTGVLLTVAGFDPTVIVGGEVDFFGGNWRNGAGDFVVCEADESDGTFLKLMPRYAILTNIDEEHLDHYRDLTGVVKANKTFMEQVRGGGCLIACYDDPHIRGLLKAYRRRVLTYGLSEEGPDIYARNIRMHESRSSFEAVVDGMGAGVFELNIPGKQNILNSLAVIMLGIELGIDAAVIRQALKSYRGTARRFQIKGTVDDIMIVEDYAHHPAEIAATIGASKNWPDRRLVGIFQPHRYTRTHLLKESFGRSFQGLDELILTDIYGASEKPIDGVTTKVIYDEVVKNGQVNVSLLKKDKIVPYLVKTLRRNDMVLVLGAGDIGALSDELVKGLGDQRQGTIQRASV